MPRSQPVAERNRTARPRPMHRRECLQALAQPRPPGPRTSRRDVRMRGDWRDPDGDGGGIRTGARVPSHRSRVARVARSRKGRGSMRTEALLASLMAQAEGRGVDLITLRALVEESSQAGARRALASLGLDDEKARRDMDELRELLSAWRDAKRSAWRAVVTWVVRLGCAMLIAGMAVKMGFV